VRRREITGPDEIDPWSTSECVEITDSQMLIQPDGTCGLTMTHLHRCPAMNEQLGTWRLEAVIAVGGLGEIWRAVRGNDVVALKRLHTHLAGNDEVRAQFTIEQRLTTQLPRHANLVHAVEASAVDDRPYIALALAPGDDLRRLLAPAPPAAARATDAAAPPVSLPRSRSLAIMLAAAEAAAHLHRHGFVHGDINPSNLVVSTDLVTLVDLGVAREIGTAGVVRGTAAYMAPEQVRGERWTRATDVFALGVVLWELVAGARLFHRGPPWLSMSAVVEAAAPALGDPALDAIAQAALIKDPAQRIASADELATRLRAVASDHA
jgi:serine/threonine protein kinase